MPKRTQIICIHEGKKGRSIDPVFANAFLKAYDPEWLRPFATGKAYFKPCGGKSKLLQRFPQELKNCIAAGSDTTLIVLADLDEKLKSGDELKEKYREKARESGITGEMFEKAVFICPKDQIENWIEYLDTGSTDENAEGRRVKNFSDVKNKAKLLAEKCRRSHLPKEPFPPSLEWSCNNWRALTARMR